MNIIPRIPRTSSIVARRATALRRPNSLYGGYYTLSTRRFSEKLVINDGNEFNINPRPDRHGHGLLHYLKGWKIMIWSHGESISASSVVTLSSLWGLAVMFYCIWNSVARDPEVRVRPHKKAWL
eukprot:36905_1